MTLIYAYSFSMIGEYQCYIPIYLSLLLNHSSFILYLRDTDLLNSHSIGENQLYILFITKQKALKIPVTKAIKFVNHM